MIRQQNTETADHIRALAARHGVSYRRTEMDIWADNVTRLSGDDVSLDEIGCLVIALQRDGHISREEAVCLQMKCFKENAL